MGANVVAFTWNGSTRVLTSATSPLGEEQTISGISKLVVYADPDGTSISGQNALTQAGVQLEIIDPGGSVTQSGHPYPDSAADQFLSTGLASTG